MTEMDLPACDLSRAKVDLLTGDTYSIWVLVLWLPGVVDSVKSIVPMFVLSFRGIACVVCPCKSFPISCSAAVMEAGGISSSFVWT